MGYILKLGRNCPQSCTSTYFCKLIDLHVGWGLAIWLKTIKREDRSIWASDIRNIQ